MSDVLSLETTRSIRELLLRRVRGIIRDCEEGTLNDFHLPAWREFVESTWGYSLSVYQCSLHLMAVWFLLSLKDCIVREGFRNTHYTQQFTAPLLVTFLILLLSFCHTRSLLSACQSPMTMM